MKNSNCLFSHDVMVAIFVSQNNETAAMFLSQTSLVGVELFSYVNFVHFFAVDSHDIFFSLPSLFGRGPNRVMGTACFDPNVQ